MSDISDCIIKILADNGVSVEQTDIWKDNGSVRNVKSIIELDFSEHDKEFEDKIAELKKDCGTVSRLLSDYQQENESLKKRIAELESENKQLKHDIDKMATSKSEWIDKAVEWQQKCEKFESKETSDFPFDPLECANYLINATYERETNGIERAFHNIPEKVNSDRYTVDELEQIAEHLLIYCKHNKENE